MRSLLLLVLIAGVALAPAVATAAPPDDRCEPYAYYCPIDGRVHYACGTKVPSSCVMSILDP